MSRDSESAYNNNNTCWIGSDEVSFYSELVFVHGFATLASGKISKKFTILKTRKFTALRQCTVCLVISGSRQIRERAGCFDWNQEHEHDYSYEHKYILCMRCWNKVEQYLFQVKLMKQQLKLTKQLTTLIYHERKKLKHRD